jgi:hypothetical protein
MGALTVPEDAYASLERIWNLPDPDVDRLIDDLKSVPVSAQPRTIASIISKKTPAISARDLEDLFDSLVSLSMVRTGANVDLEEFVDDVFGAVQKIPKDRLNLPEQFAGRFRNRLTRLLEADSLTLASKALAVMVDHEHDLCTARIFSDIRPVFGASVSEIPKAAVVMHTLKLSYHRGREIEEFFVSMDTDQLNDLAATISRAQAKTETLKLTLALAKITCIDPE